MKVGPARGAVERSRASVAPSLHARMASSAVESQSDPARRRSALEKLKPRGGCGVSAAGETRSIGVVMSFMPGKFGFIRTAPNQARGIFFPCDQAEPDLARGDRVTFVLHHDRDGRVLARQVRRVPR